MLYLGGRDRRAEELEGFPGGRRAERRPRHHRHFAGPRRQPSARVREVRVTAGDGSARRVRTPAARPSVLDSTWRMHTGGSGLGHGDATLKLKENVREPTFSPKKNKYFKFLTIHKAPASITRRRALRTCMPPHCEVGSSACRAPHRSLFLPRKKVDRNGGNARVAGNASVLRSPPASAAAPHTGRASSQSYLSVVG
jgi:hypothetical protein